MDVDEDLRRIKNFIYLNIFVYIILLFIICRISRNSDTFLFDNFLHFQCRSDFNNHLVLFSIIFLMDCKTFL